MTGYLGKNYIGHPTVQIGSKVRCLKAAVFADVGVTIIAVLNAMRCLRVEKMKDNN